MHKLVVLGRHELNPINGRYDVNRFTGDMIDLGVSWLFRPAYTV
jgi:hypothetical protein